MVTVQYMHLLCDQTAITTGDAADIQIRAMEGVGRKEQEEKKIDRRRKEGRKEGACIVITSYPCLSEIYADCLCSDLDEKPSL